MKDKTQAARDLMAAGWTLDEVTAVLGPRYELVDPWGFVRFPANIAGPYPYPTHTITLTAEGRTS